jgi:hypothetical protein
MADQFGPEEVDKMLETIAVVEANAQLLLADIKAAKLKAKQMEASLALVVGFLSECADIEGGFVAQRVTEQLRLCADDPDLAAQTAGCEVDHVDPAMLRAAACVIFGPKPSVQWPMAEQGATMH